MIFPYNKGLEIPMTIIYNDKIKLDRTNRCLIQGYGAYGLNLDMGFNIANLTAVENDWVLAFAHVRGGTENGSFYIYANDHL